MLETLGIVDACFESSAELSRITRQVGGKSVLEWVVRRATEAQQLDGVIVLARDASQKETIKRHVPLDVPLYATSADDVLGCWAETTAEFPCRAVVRIPPFSPLLDPTLLDRLVVEASAHRAEASDYIGFMLKCGKPATLSASPVFGEWFRSKAIHKAARSARGKKYRNDPTLYILSRPKQFRLMWLPCPTEIDREDVRLTLEGDEDREHIEVIFDVLGPDCDWHRVVELLDCSPSLRKQMADLNRKKAAENVAEKR